MANQRNQSAWDDVLTKHCKEVTKMSIVQRF